MNPQFNEEFLKWLSETPEMLARFLEVAKAWAENQNVSPDVPASDSGPREFEIGGKVGVEFEGITNEDIDALKQAYAEAQTKEKAFAYLRGFVAGIMLVSG